MKQQAAPLLSVNTLPTTLWYNKSSLRECLKKLNQYLYENCKGNRDYDLKSNNEIAKVEQLEIEIGKSMMSSVF